MATENERARDAQRRRVQRDRTHKEIRDSLKGDPAARAQLERNFAPVTRMTTDEAIRRGL